MYVYMYFFFLSILCQELIDSFKILHTGPLKFEQVPRWA